MSTIIAGRFETQDAADAAVAALERAGFAATDVQSFYLTPRGMRGNVPVVDNDQPAVGTKHAGPKAAVGAAAGAVVGLAVGVAAAPLAAPAAAAAGAVAGVGVGAYGGALVGGVSGSGGGDVEAKAEHEEPIERRSGMIVAVRADAAGPDHVIQALRDAGAEDIERATGEWQNGEWVDFDPTSFPDFVDQR
jgi:uncharacterized membrane protein